MEIFFIIISILIIVLTLNISLDICLEYDLLKNIGYIKFKVFGATIFKAEISLIAGYFNLVRKNRKVIQIKVDINDKNIKFIGDVGEYFSKKIFFTNINTVFKLYGTDPYKLAILSGNIVVLEGIARSIIKTKSPDTTVINTSDIGYVDNIIKISLSVGVLLTLFDFVWAILRAIIKRSIYEKSKFRRKC